jgi:hypothetical protein
MISEAYRGDGLWDGKLPRTLVVCCSDGRFQQEVDEFLSGHLGIARYDRLYVPGGAGALSASGIEFTRAHSFRKECEFLLTAHGIEQIIMLFHGPSTDGPDEAICGDYRRILPTSSAKEIRRRQEQDALEILQQRNWKNVAIRIYRCEVSSDGVVQFLPSGGRDRE